ncbi:MAG TPA: hypothetical protein VGB04_11495 [Allosphingosinicella sp.]
MRRAGLLLALAAAGCAHRPPPPADCVEAYVPFAVRALTGIFALANPAPATVEAGFVLCSADESRLIAASTALGAKGYSSYIGNADRRKCLRVARTHEASGAAVEREMTLMCRIAEAHGIAYRHWQAEIGGRSVHVAGDRVTVDGRRLN